jgi:hypothetical protein
MKFFKLFSLALIASLSFTSCGTDTPVDPTVVTKEYAQFGFIHAATDVAGVDVALDGSKKTTALVAYGATMPYAQTELVNATKTKIAVTVGTTTLTDSLLINSATNSVSKKFGFLTIAYLDSAVVATVRAPKLYTFANDLAAPTGTKAKINVVHLVADAAKTGLDVRYVTPGAVASTTSPAIATNVQFRAVSTFFEIDPGTYDMKFLKTGGVTLFVSLANTGTTGGAGVKVEAGKIYTVVMRGFDAGIGARNVGLSIFQHN